MPRTILFVLGLLAILGVAGFLLILVVTYLRQPRGRPPRDKGGARAATAPATDPAGARGSQPRMDARR